ncbi:MAG: 5-oxoprolinase [Symploca sp. SIO2B6]|nr:5-oxoprolinase [Symploca sp. SIO2B6]
MKKKWKFFADRGGTFTDIVAVSPEDKIIVHKVLSENSQRYKDAVVQGIREILGIEADQPIPSPEIEVVKMGTTVATNALLERKGDRTVLVTTKGFGDALRIGYQNRPDIFALEIILPEMLYEQVIEVEERYSAHGSELILLNIPQTKAALQQAYDSGIRSCAIALMHGYRYPEHENQVASIATEIGFTQISISHQVSPLMKFVSRGDTTVVDAYLSPILRRYVEQVSSELSAAGNNQQTTKLMFMQSSGGLVNAKQFQGKNSILSGPAGGIVGAVQTSANAGFNKIVTFDMGGTSTDVAHYAGEYEREFETEVAGVRLRAPMMAIHTVAAGGGSILSFDGSRYRVGPESAGANPGPTGYRQGGPLTVTDCNIMLGKIQPEFFPKVFGSNGDLPLDAETVRQKFSELTNKIGDGRTPEQVAAGFLAIAVDNMANAIKKISLQRGYDVSEYTLCSFGGAGGQHACLIADALGVTQVFIHPYAGVLSAYGIGLADVRVIEERAVEASLEQSLMPSVIQVLAELETEGTAQLKRQDVQDIAAVEIERKLHLRYEKSDFPLIVDFAEDVVTMVAEFEAAHQQRYGFIYQHRGLIVEAVTVEVVGKTNLITEAESKLNSSGKPESVATVSIYTNDAWQETPIYPRQNLQAGDLISGPALITEPNSTNVIEPGWQAQLTTREYLIIKRVKPLETKAVTTEVDPVRLEIFNNLFRAIAQQMGITLQNTSSSANIKERLDFSCALFDGQGLLIANAPHIPVHLGSMSESVKALIESCSESIKPGDVYASNNPYHGGTHLPDITVITPVFTSQVEQKTEQEQILFYVASRAHHADIGGITPGSMPPSSTSIEQEGVLIDNFQLVQQGKFREQELLTLLSSGDYPARNLEQNLVDLQAQIAANECGVQEIRKMVEQFGLETVCSYMGYVQDNAEESVRRVIEVLKEGEFTYVMDHGGQIKVAIAVNRDKRSAKIDFTGTSPQLETNFNAPAAVCKAAVIYFFRTLVNDDIPLNAGCLKPLEIIIPSGCMLNPSYPAAVVAGNVETSQAITNALYEASGVMASSQGTMNNFTFGNERYQYYETICGGSGAGATFDGTDAVQCHMTNSRLTDPEVLEWRFPVLLESFGIRTDSGGIGNHHGGNGVNRRIRFLEPMTAGILSGHRVVPVYGLNGGGNGAVGRNYIERKDGTVEELGSTATRQMQEGDVFVIETPGGGGYGK